MREITLELDAVPAAGTDVGPATGRLAVMLHGSRTRPTVAAPGTGPGDAGWRVVAPSHAGTHRPRSPRTAAGTSPPDGRRGGRPRLRGRGSRRGTDRPDWGAITANALAAHPDSPFVAAVALSVPRFPRCAPRRCCPRCPVSSATAGTSCSTNCRAAEKVGGPDCSAPVGGLVTPATTRRTIYRRDGGHGRSGTPAHRDRLLPQHGSALPRPPVRYRRWVGAEMRSPIVPTLYLHGDRDGCLDPRLAARVGSGCHREARRTSSPGPATSATGAARRVNSTILKFLRRRDRRRRRRRPVPAPTPTLRRRADRRRSGPGRDQDAPTSTRS